LVSPHCPGDFQAHLHFSRPWSPLDWTSSDDRVRGGSSYSALECSPFSPIAVFKGNLDIKPLGGAGFASQRTTGEDRQWDLSKYDGLVLDIAKSDGKKYTLILKDELLPKSPNGREQSTVSWEYDFATDSQELEDRGKGKVLVKWEDLKPTYRGREKKDAEPLDLTNVKRISLMMRRYVLYSISPEHYTEQHSFFGTQEGDFSFSIVSISTAKHSSSESQDFSEPYRDEPNEKEASGMQDSVVNSSKNRSWGSWLFGLCTGS